MTDLFQITCCQKVRKFKHIYIYIYGLMVNVIHKLVLDLNRDIASQSKLSTSNKFTLC